VTTKTNPPVFSIALISAAALAYEILLMRLFSIIQWHHFAYMMISLALLGYGASGTFLALGRRMLRGRFQTAYFVNAVMFGISAVGCFLIAQAIPFNALEVLWNPWQPLWLMLIFLLLFIPFFCAANCICLAFTEFRTQLHRIYCFDLLGAGAGALFIIGLLFVVHPGSALNVVGAMGMTAAVLAGLECKMKPRWPLVGILLLITGLLAPGTGIDLQISQYKGLSQSLQVLGAEQIDEQSSPLGLLTTVRNPVIPFRHAPGLSLASPAPIPEQLAVFTDSDSLSVLTRFAGDLDEIAYLDYLSSALPYHLLEQPHVLVLGAGGGADVLQALYHGAGHIDAVELNPQVVNLVNEKFSEFTGAIYERPDVVMHQREARGFVSASESRYDLIQVAMMDSFGASSAGLFALSENYLYTVEAFEEYLQHLAPGGILSISRWLKIPPRDGLKIFATAVEALERSGISHAGQHLVMIRSWNTSTLLVKQTAFTASDLESLKAFCKDRWFDLAWYPGMSGAEANRYNQLREAWFFQGASRLLEPGRDAYLGDYKFNIRPATDDRPHFFHFLKWQTVRELLALRGQGGLPLLEWGYVILVATLLLTLLASFLLVLLPLWIRRSAEYAERGLRWRIVVYFLAIGAAFMFVEIAFIQKFILFLSHPLYAVAVVLSSFLVFAGLGSLMSERCKSFLSGFRIVVGIAIISLIYVFLLPGIFNGLVALPGWLKVVISALLIAPLAFLLGMPFPRGLDLVSNRLPSWIPWAWGLNGCASVMGAVLATLLAIHLGFVAVVLFAALLYLLAGRVLSKDIR
jgi:spermidine synthase